MSKRNQRLYRYVFVWRIPANRAMQIELYTRKPKWAGHWLMKHQSMLVDLKEDTHQCSPSFGLREHAWWAATKQKDKAILESVAEWQRRARKPTAADRAALRALKRKDRMEVVCELITHWTRKRKLAETKLKRYQREWKRYQREQEQST